MDDFEKTLLTDNYLAALRSSPHHQSYEVTAKDHELVTSVLVSVMYELTKRTKLRDEWESVTAFERTGSWPHAFRKTKKTALEVSVSIDLGGIFFKCDLCHGDMLPCVDDRFWQLFVRIVLDHGGNYELTQWPKQFASAPGEREISRARKSAVFSMVADYILVTKVSDRDPPIGDLTFRFDWNGKWNLIIPRMVEITTMTWQMSYLLYRAAYQRRRDMAKRVKRRLEQGR